MSKNKPTFVFVIQSVISKEKWTLKVQHEIVVCLFALVLLIITMSKVPSYTPQTNVYFIFSLQAFTFVFSRRFMILHNNCLYAIPWNETYYGRHFIVIILPEYQKWNFISGDKMLCKYYPEMKSCERKRMRIWTKRIVSVAVVELEQQLFFFFFLFFYLVLANLHTTTYKK